MQTAIDGVTVLGIFGMGGVGKTALALKIAEEQMSSYPDAQIYLDLKGTSENPILPAQAMAHVIWAFHPEGSLPPNDDEIAALYHSVLHDRRTLLLMDNASGRAQIEPLIPPAGNLLLVTSQFRFHIPGLRGESLTELAKPDSRELLLRIEPRIGDVADQIADICSGIPFALRNAAGALAARPDLVPARYAERLRREKERCGLIEASISLSYDLLSEESATRWCTLAVFPVTFDLAAAGYIWQFGQEETEAVLEDLVLRSLVQGSEGRYWLHDLARVFAGGRLGQKERAQATIRHSRHYLEVVAQSAQAFLDGQQVAALRTFDANWPNIKAGFWNAVEAVKELAVLYPIACQPFFSLRIHSQEALRWLEAVLSLSQETHETGGRQNTATLLNMMGLVLRSVGRHGDARTRFQEALAAASDLDNGVFEETILGNLGHELISLGDLEQARTVLDKAYSMARGVGDSRGEIVALGGLERLYSESRDFPRALEFAHLWLEASRRSYDRQSEAQALGNMGVIYMHIEDPEKAIECFERDLCIARELGDERGEAACIGNLGCLHAEWGEQNKAIELLEIRISMARDLGDVRGESESSWALGWVYEALGDLARAAELLQVRLDYLRAIDHPETDNTAAEIRAVRARIGEPASSSGE